LTAFGVVWGMLACAEEFNSFSRTLAKRRVEKVYDTTKQVLALAADEGIPAVDRLAERLIAPGEPIVTDPVWNTRRGWSMPAGMEESVCGSVGVLSFSLR
jgi:hypothetical protein